jgi:phenylpropionate dioxygenase-like ring-hydroxylating dioxygenase large terminal subunit
MHAERDSLIRETDALAATRREVREARHAPGYIYCSPEFYRAEVEEYFMRDWLFVAREEELANPGDYMALRLVDQPVVISRDKDGQLNASYNMCLHRGVEVAYGAGNAASFKCPYHGWTYDIAGKLIGAPHMGQSKGFDIKACRLKQIRIDSWRGNVFITFNRDAPSLAEYVSDLEHDFGFLGMEKCRLGYKITQELDCNWKLVHENYLDFYHVHVLHSKTTGARFSWKDEDWIKRENGITLFYKASPHTPGGELLFGKTPWLAERDLTFACTGYRRPNFTLFGRVDTARIACAWPLGPNKCVVVIHILFPEEFLQRADFTEKVKIAGEFQKRTLGEDVDMLISLQKAMPLPAFAPGPMSYLENPIHHYLNSHLDRIVGQKRNEEADR